MNEERICPNCGSENVEPDNRRTNVLGEAVFNNSKWLCNDCDYSGIMPVGESSDEMEYEPEDQEAIDGSAGKGFFEYSYRIVLPAAVGFVVAFVVFGYM